MKLQSTGIDKRYAIAVLNEAGAFLGFVPDLHPVTFPDHALRFASVRGVESAIEAVHPTWARQGNRLIPWDLDYQAPADWSSELRDEETREIVPARPCSCTAADHHGYLESLAICLEASATRLRRVALELARSTSKEDA